MQACLAHSQRGDTELAIFEEAFILTYALLKVVAVSPDGARFRAHRERMPNILVTKDRLAMEKDRIDIDTPALGFYWKNELPPAEYLITPHLGRRLTWGLLMFLGGAIAICGIVVGLLRL